MRPLLFDAAHGYGSLREGVHVGALGDVECSRSRARSP